MLFAGTGETGMVHEVSGAVVVNERGIVALGDFDIRVVVAAPLDRAHQALADVALPVVADGLVEIAVLPASSTYGPVMSLERNMRIW